MKATQFQTMNFMKHQTMFHLIFNIISGNNINKDSKEQSQMQESNKISKKQIKNDFIHKQHEELPRNDEISQLTILKKDNEELKRENDELKRKLKEKSKKQSNIIHGVKVEINKIKQILSNAQQQRFIYLFENIDTESIGSLEKSW